MERLSVIIVVGSLASEVVVANESVVSNGWFGTVVEVVVGMVVGSVVGNEVGSTVGNVIGNMVVRTYVTSIRITCANASEHILIYPTLDQSNIHIQINQNKNKNN